MISHRGISVITPLPSGEGKGEGPLPHRGISVITPLPLGEGKGEGPLTHRGPSAYREHRAFQLSLGVMYVREESLCGDKKSLQSTKLTTLNTRIYHHLQPRI